MSELHYDENSCLKVKKFHDRFVYFYALESWFNAYERVLNLFKHKSFFTNFKKSFLRHEKKERLT